MGPDLLLFYWILFSLIMSCLISFLLWLYLHVLVMSFCFLVLDHHLFLSSSLLVSSLLIISPWLILVSPHFVSSHLSNILLFYLLLSSLLILTHHILFTFLSCLVASSFFLIITHHSSWFIQSHPVTTLSSFCVLIFSPFLPCLLICLTLTQLISCHLPSFSHLFSHPVF